jgi:recombinational DNA repair protein RecT
VNDDKYKEYFMDNMNVWKNSFDKVKEFIDLNCKRPSSTSKNKEEKVLGFWIGRQLKNAKNKTQIMKEVEIYNLWNEFVNDDKYKEYFMDNMNVWKNKLDKVKEFIDLNYKRPLGKSKNKEEKVLGSWIGTQMKNTKNKTEIMKEIEIYNLWNEFVNDDKYKEYFNN